MLHHRSVSHWPSRGFAGSLRQSLLSRPGITAGAGSGRRTELRAYHEDLNVLVKGIVAYQMGGNIK